MKYKAPFFPDGNERALFVALLVVFMSLAMVLPAVIIPRLNPVYDQTPAKKSLVDGTVFEDGMPGPIRTDIPRTSG